MKRKSTHSNPDGACVGVDDADGAIQVTDSAHPASPVLQVTREAWAAFATRL